MRVERGWIAAIAEHENAIRTFVAACRRVESSNWQRAPALGKWSPAAVALHVCQAYEFGRDAAVEDARMRLRVAPPLAWLSRTVILPIFLATKRFPRGAKAPAEVVPDAAEARLLTQDAAAARLHRAAEESATALRRAAAERPTFRVTHAYFGALTPYSTVRLLSAHTNHHARVLAAATTIAHHSQPAPSGTTWTP